LRERHGGRRVRCNARRGAGASAQGIQGIAALQEERGEQQCAEGPQASGNSFHKAIVHRRITRMKGLMVTKVPGAGLEGKRPRPRAIPGDDDLFVLESLSSGKIKTL
jgi:hypothetical protein